VDLAKIAELGVPFWLAGGYGSHHGLQQALAAGATGIQVGTAFAFCEESGMRADYRHRLIAKSIDGDAKVFTNPVASPTGFPFKVAQLEGTTSEESVYRARPRICDLGYLREAYKTEEGAIGYRCSAEPVSIYLSKDGKVEDTVGRQCVCNALMANIGMSQTRANGKHVEVGLVTTGNDLVDIKRFLEPGKTTYSAADVIENLLGTKKADSAAEEVEVHQAAVAGSLM